jgi:hypothetical protein
LLAAMDFFTARFGTTTCPPTTSPVTSLPTPAENYTYTYGPVGNRLTAGATCVSPQPDPASLAALLRPIWDGLSVGLRESEARANGWSDAAGQNSTKCAPL